MARGKKYAPSDDELKKDIRWVSQAAMSGWTHKKIAQTMGVSLNTLKKYFSEQLKLNKERANLNMEAALYNNGIKGNVVAQIFWMKTQAGWRETGMSEDHNRQRPVIKYADRED